MPQPTLCEITVIADREAAAADVERLKTSLANLRSGRWEYLDRTTDTDSLAEVLAHARGTFVLIVRSCVELIDNSIEKIMWLLDADPTLGAVVFHPPFDAGGAESDDAAMVIIRTDASGLSSVLDTGSPIPPVVGDLAFALTRSDVPTLNVRAAIPYDRRFASPGGRSPIRIFTPVPATTSPASTPGGRRVLAIVPWMEIGGADRYNLDVLRAAKNAGWNLGVVTTEQSPDPLLEEFTALTNRIHRLSRLARPDEYPSYLGQILVDESPDVVLISNSETGYQLIPFMRHHTPDAAFIDLVHAEQPEWKEGGFARYSTQYRDHMDVTAAVSTHLATWLRNAGSDPTRVHVCRAGVDTTWWTPDRTDRTDTLSRFGLDPASNIATFSGRLAHQKQPDVFLEAVARANEHGANYNAFVVGDGLMQGQLKELADSLHISVALVGSVDARTMRAILRATDVAVLPSQAEGIAIALMEAMACGVTVVSADVGGQAELVTDESGFLVGTPNREHQVTEYGNILADLSLDPDLRVRMGEGARQRIVEAFDVTQTGDRFVELLDLAQRVHVDTPNTQVTRPEADRSAWQATSHIHTSRQIADLEASNAWLSAQVEAWQLESARLGEQVSELKLWIDALETGKQWLETQVESWKATAQGTDSDER